ncbi:hypothetical protein IE077_000367 [Cardiosporidium cionae]|uniref:AP2/ERF domain-containing protein n=1 Tax=Cardiosporidium cionae TaxID=476202 RepID=A0ABQ7JAM0_9APIC|nr:hypothetical protein IE077_000367 [Cardiosporidium cionae]|eukprot:KAF8821014.1 hypothetical protein IE077_000367 [Cardiosporidium cionae]
MADFHSLEICNPSPYRLENEPQHFIEPVFFLASEEDQQSQGYVDEKICWANCNTSTYLPFVNTSLYYPFRDSSAHVIDIVTPQFAHTSLPLFDPLSISIYDAPFPSCDHNSNLDRKKVDSEGLASFPYLHPSEVELDPKCSAQDVLSRCCPPNIKHSSKIESKVQKDVKLAQENEENDSLHEVITSAVTHFEIRNKDKLYSASEQHSPNKIQSMEEHFLQLPFISGVKYQPSDRRWIARWTTLSGKRACRSFSVNIYGFEEARSRAIQCRQLGSRKRRKYIKRNESDGNVIPTGVMKGIRYDNTQQRWVSSYYEGGKRKFRYFPSKEDGFEVAKQKAIEWKQKKDERYLEAPQLTGQEDTTEKVILFDKANDYFVDSLINNHESNPPMSLTDLISSCIKSKICQSNSSQEGKQECRSTSMLDFSLGTMNVKRCGEKRHADLQEAFALQDQYPQYGSTSTSNEHNSFGKKVDDDANYKVDVEYSAGLLDMHSFAKPVALDCYNSKMDQNTRTPVNHIPGVTFDRKNQRWGARWSAPDGRRAGKYFPVNQYGYEDARILAIQCRREAMQSTVQNSTTQSGTFLNRSSHITAKFHRGGKKKVISQLNPFSTESPNIVAELESETITANESFCHHLE